MFKLKKNDPFKYLSWNENAETELNCIHCIFIFKLEWENEKILSVKATKIFIL